MPVNKDKTARLAVSVPRVLEKLIKLQAGLQRRSVSNFIENALFDHFSSLSDSECEMLWAQYLQTMSDEERDVVLKFRGSESAKDNVKVLVTNGINYSQTNTLP